MRTNTKMVYIAFLAGKKLNKCPAIHTNGRYIYSYNTIIAARDPQVKDGYVVTSETYSKTTTIHTNGIACALRMAGYPVRYVSELDLE